MVAVLLALDLLVISKVTLYNVPAASVPVEIVMLAVEDSTVLLSSKKLSESFFVVTSTLTPALGILDEIFTLKVYVPEVADAVADPGSGSIVNTIFSSVTTTGGGVGVGVPFLVQDDILTIEIKIIAIKKVLFIGRICIKLSRKMNVYQIFLGQRSPYLLFSVNPNTISWVPLFMVLNKYFPRFKS